MSSPLIGTGFDDLLSKKASHYCGRPGGILYQMALNVLHAPTRWDIGGTEKAAELFIRAHSQDFDVYGVGLHEGGPRADSLRKLGYDIYQPGDVSDLAAYMSEKEIDIVHSHSGDSEMVSAAATDADVPIHVRTDQFGRYFQPEKGNQIDYFFYPSKSILLRTIILNQLGYSDNWCKDMAHLYNPLDTEEISQGRSLRDRYDIPESTPVVGKIGRPVPEKWGKLTIKAFDRVLQRTPEAQLILVGVPNKIRKQIRSYGWGDRVIYVDPLPPEEVSDFYATIDVLAHTSAIGESYGYVIAEAMANGVPPVVDSTPMRDNAQVELVRHDETGYVANSPMAYGDAISELLQDEETLQQFSDAAKERVTEFDVKQVVTRLEQFYRRLAVDAGLLGTESAPGFISLTENLSEFHSDYNQKIGRSYGQADTIHRLEKVSWNSVEKLPVGRKPTFELGRKAFIFFNEYI